MILSFDIEQWSDSGFSYNDAFDHCCYRNFFENVLRPLCVENGLRPVLYCVARDSKLIDYWLREFDLINKVIIGSHSVTHRKLSQIGDDEFFEEIKLSKDILENELGVACLHFRAPRFEIPLSKDRFYETLFNAGYISDSSIFSGFRLDGNSTKLDDLHPYDYGGVTEIPVGILYSVFGGTRFFALGGGYFRLAPRVLLRLMMNYRIQGQMTYFHPNDFDPDSPLPVDLIPRFRQGIGRTSTRQKLIDLASMFDRDDDIDKFVTRTKKNY